MSEITPSQAIDEMNRRLKDRRVMIADFKAWFAVFNEAIDGTPTPKQWTRIKAKVDELYDRVGIAPSNIDYLDCAKQQTFYASDE